MYYVYILQSLSYPKRHYTGFTEDIEKRLIKHNEGGCLNTAKYRPWKIASYIAFESEEKAIKFGKYLKSHSGRAFSKKHF